MARLEKNIGHINCSYVSWLRRVDRATKADYEMGRQITIDGWIISETEARLCALHHLQQLP